MSVCLHCGEIASEGALFCTKCGFTLPQVDASAGNGPVVPAPPPSMPGASSGASAPPASPSPPPPPSFGHPWAYAPGGYATIDPLTPGAVGPIPPPPVGKYCIRCRTVISRVAVYCPVCQQPQS